MFMNNITKSFTSALSSLLSTASATLSSTNNTNPAIVNKLSSLEAVLEVEPFIRELPHGEMLWLYVLTGQHKTELEALNAFVDLDHVLVMVHAKLHAPKFFKQLKQVSPYSGFFDQNEVHECLRRAMFDISDALLADKSPSRAEKKAFKHAYLRLLDIFFCICDQYTLDDEFYDQLVAESSTQCLNTKQFYTRYSLEDYGGTDSLPVRLQEKMTVIFKQLNSRTCDLGLDEIKKFDLIADETRFAYDCSSWKKFHVGSLTFASYLLYRDHQQGINDSYTKQLYQYVEDNLEGVIQNSIQDKGAKDPLMAWLSHAANSDSSAQVLSEIKSSLATETLGAGADSRLGNTQPCYELFDGISRYLTIIKACYWLNATGRWPMAKRVLRLSIELAPQRTIYNISKLYRQGDAGEFESRRALKQFLKSMLAINVPQPQVSAFEVSYCQQHDSKKYIDLVADYWVGSKPDQLAIMDQGLLYVNAIERQKFYLDVHRFKRDTPYQLQHELAATLAEHLIGCAVLDHLCIAGAFNAQDRRVIEWIEEDPGKLTKPLIKDQNMIELPHWPRMQVIIEQQDNYCLLADSSDMHLDVDNYQWPDIGDLVLFKPQVDKQLVLDKINNLPALEQRYQLIGEIAEQYIDQQITWAQYQEKVGAFVNVDDYNWVSKNYANKRNSLVPFIVSELDLSRRNRLLKIFCSSNDLESDSLFSDISFQLFLEQLLSEQTIGLVDRENSEVDDLTDQAAANYQAFSQELAQQLITMEGAS